MNTFFQTEQLVRQRDFTSANEVKTLSLEIFPSSTVSWVVENQTFKEYDNTCKFIINVSTETSVIFS